MFNSDENKCFEQYLCEQVPNPNNGIKINCKSNSISSLKEIKIISNYDRNKEMNKNLYNNYYNKVFNYINNEMNDYNINNNSVVMNKYNRNSYFTERNNYNNNSKIL